MLPEVLLTAAAAFVLILVIAFLVMRHQKELLRHRERMATLDKGLPPPPAPPRLAPHRIYLLRGMIWTMVGAMLTVLMLAFLSAAATAEHPRPEDLLREKLWRQKNLRDMGATEQQIAEVERVRPENPRRSGPPVVMGLIGLVPAAVGVAYLLFYRSEEKRLAQTSSADSGS